MDGIDAPHLHLRSDATSGAVSLGLSATSHSASRRPPTDPQHGTKKTRTKETRLGERCRGDSHAEGIRCLPSTDEIKYDPSPPSCFSSALGCHNPATTNAHGATPPSHRTSLALWRWILVRDVAFEGAACIFFCAALNKRPSLCDVPWWSAGVAQGGAK